MAGPTASVTAQTGDHAKPWPLPWHYFFRDVQRVWSLDAIQKERVGVARRVNSMGVACEAPVRFPTCKLISDLKESGRSVCDSLNLPVFPGVGIYAVELAFAD
jgi:hypothetical protein